MMDGKMPSNRKRVKFSYDEPDPDEIRKERKVRFPKGKKEKKDKDSKTAEETLDVFGSEPYTATDPRVAATERAVRRVQAEQLDETCLPNDVLDAEEEYEGGQGQEEDDEVPLEPFNLKQERKEGYFDADGNYVEYRNENDVKDAWLDTVEVDTSLADKHMKRYAEEEIERTLSTKEVAAIKRRIADALQPGETVLQALRRLKATSTEKDKHAKAKMSNETKAAFDMLTEDAMKLLDHGEYDVYNETKETFEGDSEAGTSNGGDLFTNVSVSGMSTYGQVNGSEAQGSVDMFADDENEGDLTGQNTHEASQANTGEGLPSESGYIYDEASGYYYNSTLAYYYDPNSGLFCNAASGMWYRFDEESNTYIEAKAEEETTVKESFEI